MELSLLVLLGFFATQLVGCKPACSIFGCQGHFAEPNSTDPDSSTSPTTTTTTTTTWTEPDSFVCKEGNDAACAEYLNAVYMSYDEANPTSALGVPMRGRPGFSEEPWYFCTGECHDGQPDCYVAGALLNHRLMISKNNSARIIMEDPVFIIFQPVTALHKLIKCAWQYDGAAFGRNNGGCGPGAQSQDCENEFSAYQDKCPDEGNGGYADENCGSVMSAWCGTELKEYPATCFWKGPAFYSPVYPGAEADLSRLDEDNEIGKMLSQRMASQSFDKSTGDGIAYTEYWNEINMDGRIISRLLAEDASQVIAAIGYVKGTTAHGSAQAFRDSFVGAYGITVPIVSFDVTADISKTGPFGTEEADAALQTLI